MTVSTTTRLQLTRWSDKDDPLTRSQLDADHAKLESRVAGFVRDTLDSRPAAGPGNVGFLFEATDTGQLFWSTGVTWLLLSPNYARVMTSVTAPSASTTTLAQLTIAAGDLTVPGRVAKLACWGSATSGGNPSDIGVSLGGVNLANLNTTTWDWRIEIDLLAAGPTAQRVSNRRYVANSVAVNSQLTSIDMTADKVLAIVATTGLVATVTLEAVTVDLVR